jgi:ribonuclease-3
MNPAYIPDRLPRLETLNRFQTSLSLSFNDINLLDTALTHRSAVNESAGAPVAHNERLEFLGDAVLGQAVAAILYRRMAGRPEGELARVKSIVVSEQSLAPVAERLGIPAALRLGRGEELSGGRKKKALLADALEALLGALYLDQGDGAVLALVQRLLGSSIEECAQGFSKDAKTVLQEYAQKYLSCLPEYRVSHMEGPEHEKLFWVICVLEGRSHGPFRGSTKKEAEQAAALGVLEFLQAGSRTAADRLAAISGRPAAS